MAAARLLALDPQKCLSHQVLEQVTTQWYVLLIAKHKLVRQAIRALIVTIFLGVRAVCS